MSLFCAGGRPTDRSVFLFFRRTRAPTNRSGGFRHFRQQIPFAVRVLRVTLAADVNFDFFEFVFPPLSLSHLSRDGEEAGFRIRPERRGRSHYLANRRQRLPSIGNPKRLFYVIGTRTTISTVTETDGDVNISPVADRATGRERNANAVPGRHRLFRRHFVAAPATVRIRNHRARRPYINTRTCRGIFRIVRTFV